MKNQLKIMYIKEMIIELMKSLKEININAHFIKIKIQNLYILNLLIKEKRNIIIIKKRVKNIKAKVQQFINIHKLTFPNVMKNII